MLPFIDGFKANKKGLKVFLPVFPYEVKQKTRYLVGQLACCFGTVENKLYWNKLTYENKSNCFYKYFQGLIMAWIYIKKMMIINMNMGENKIETLLFFPLYDANGLTLLLPRCLICNHPVQITVELRHVTSSSQWNVTLRHAIPRCSDVLFPIKQIRT